MKIGLERLLADRSLSSGWGRCGLLSNQASVTSEFKPAWEVMQSVLGKELTAIFGPQHGFFGTKQDNMIETLHALHEPTGLPLFSLYSETREPTEAMLANLDTIVIDLQIVGCRIYTWKATIAGCLRSAKQFNKKVVVLDRPNPVGGQVLEGRVLDADCASFVGEYPIPMRHGLSAGEAARFFNSFIHADLEVIQLEGWNPHLYWHELERPWVLTSPNLPNVDSLYVYPGTVIFEGVNLSEGRGTGLPFQFVGAPYISSTRDFKNRVVSILGGECPGLFLREAQFEPTSQKWKGETCKGLQLHVTDCRQIRSVNLAIAIIRAAIEMGQKSFDWKQPPYEYVHDVLPMKIIYGSRDVDRKFKDAHFSLNDPFWHEGLKDYVKRVKDYLLYDRDFIVD
jgi:uncharacterized protein YbbC (DUF1343 family)